jgi:hypothetical protein
MSKNPKPTSEELRFVYEMILGGLNDGDILAEYAHLYDLNQLKFPYRTDKRFIQERRRELNTVREVLEDYLRKKVDPLVVKAKQEHFQFLTDIVRSLLENGLNNVEVIYNSDDIDLTKPIYAVMTYTPDHEPTEGLDLRKLIGRVRGNFASSVAKYGYTQVNSYFLPHLRAENIKLALNKLDDFTATGDEVLKIIETLKLLSIRKTFEGSCPVCIGWI